LLGDWAWVESYYHPPKDLAAQPIVESNGGERPRLQVTIAWCTRLLELTPVEIRDLAGAPPGYSDIRQDWDEPFRRARQVQAALLSSLSEDERYAWCGWRSADPKACASSWKALRN
jgi:hypothetical protein